MGASPFRQYDRRLEILFSYFRSSCKLKSGTRNQAGLCRVLDGTAIFCRVRLQPPRQRREQERRQVDRKLRQREVEPGEVGQRADWTVARDQSLVDARDRSFQSAPCFCQFIRMWRLVALFLPSAAAWLSATQWNRTIAAGPTTRILGSWYSSDKNFVFPLVALAMNVALSSTRPSEWL